MIVGAMNLAKHFFSPKDDTQENPRSVAYYEAHKDDLTALFGEHKVVDLGVYKSTVNLGSLSLDNKYYSFTIEYEDELEGKTYQFYSHGAGEANGSDDKISFYLHKHLSERMDNILSVWEAHFPRPQGEGAYVSGDSSFFRRSQKGALQELVAGGIDFSHFSPSQLQGCADPNIRIVIQGNNYTGDPDYYDTPEEILSKCIDIVSKITEETELICDVRFSVSFRESREGSDHYDYYSLSCDLVYLEDEGKYMIENEKDSRDEEEQEEV